MRLFSALFLLALGAVVTATVPAEPIHDAGPDANAQFASLSQRWLDGSMRLSPASATQTGDHRFDSELDDLSKEGFDKSGLDLTSYEGVMKGTKFGPMVVPKDADSSNLVWLLDWRGSLQTRMPHGKKKLSTCDRSAIRTWIREGAKNN